MHGCLYISNHNTAIAGYNALELQLAHQESEQKLELLTSQFEAEGALAEQIDTVEESARRETELQLLEVSVNFIHLCMQVAACVCMRTANGRLNLEH